MTTILCDCCATSIRGGHPCSCGCDTDPRAIECTYCHHDHDKYPRSAAPSEYERLIAALRLAVPYVVDDAGRECWCRLHDPEISQWSLPCNGCRVRAAVRSAEGATPSEEH